MSLILNFSQYLFRIDKSRLSDQIVCGSLKLILSKYANSKAYQDFKTHDLEELLQAKIWSTTESSFVFLHI